MRLSNNKIRMKITAAVTGAAVGLSGAAFAAGIFVTPAKLFVSNSSVTPPADTTPPTVSSITRVTSSPTNAASVQFRVTFSEAVTGVDSGDFALTGAGSSGASIGSVSGSGSTRTVDVTTASNGALGLNLTDNDSIVDATGNALGGGGPGNGSFTSGEVYTIDKASPSVTSIVRAGTDPTGAASVQFTVTFSEAVSAVDTSDFALTTTGVSSPSVSSVSADSGSTRTVTVLTGTGSGTIRLDLDDNDSIVDTAGNALGGSGISNGSFTSGEAYSIDKAAPMVSSIVRVGAPITNAASVQFTVTFSEAATGVGAADFALSAPGLSGALVSGVSADTGSTRTVTVSTGTGSGTIRLDLTDDDTIVDAAGNPLGGSGPGNGSFTSGEVYTIDKTPPTATITFPTNGGVYSASTFDSGCSTAGGDFCGTAADTGGATLSAVDVSIRSSSTGQYWDTTPTAGFKSGAELFWPVTGLTSWTYTFLGSQFPSTGQYVLVARARDTATNSGSSNVTFTMDITGPTGTDVQTANKTTGGVAGRAELGDSITFTFSEPMKPESIISGWNGTGSRNVVVRIMNGTGQGNDTLAVYDASDTTQIPLGTVDLGGKNYNTEKGNTIVTFGATGTASTMTMNGSQFVILLGTASSTNVGTGANGLMSWTTMAGPTDSLGNPITTGTVSEIAPPADPEF